jgi:hypothetical protein
MGGWWVWSGLTGDWRRGWATAQVERRQKPGFSNGRVINPGMAAAPLRPCPVCQSASKVFRYNVVDQVFLESLELTGQIASKLSVQVQCLEESVLDQHGLACHQLCQITVAGD